jgi:6-phospho-3-hexuloisomerase
MTETGFGELVDRLVGELGRTLHSVNEDDLARLQALIHEAKRVFVAGKGRSGLQMSAFAMRLMHAGLSAHVVGDATTPGIAAGDLLVIGSGSGRTASMVQYAARAREQGARVALITTADTSPIGESADCVIRLNAPTPKLAEGYDPHASVLPMGSLFETSLGLLLDIVILRLMADLNLTTDQMFARHANLE